MPAFRSVGVAGFYLAVLVTAGAGLATGRSPVILALVSIACGLSFFAWALVRRTVVRREAYSLFEQVWFALLCATGVIMAFGEPPLAYLDPVALGMCAFLSVGRIGCLLVGCCHGQPSIVGIRYGSELVDDGFPPWLLGVRLFPVQLVESAGIAAIGLVGAVLVIGAAPGTAFIWFLLAYAVLRFGMEGLRGDERAFFAGLSGPRWMALGQGGVALAIADPGRLVGPAAAVLLGSLALVLAAMALWRRRSPHRLTAALLADIREFIAVPVGPGSPGEPVATRSFSGGLSVAVSPTVSATEDLHVSFAMPRGSGDLEQVAAIASAVTSRNPDGAVAVGPLGTLHVVGRPVDRSLTADEPRQHRGVYAAALRSLEFDRESNEPGTAPVFRTPPARRAYFDLRTSSPDGPAGADATKHPAQTPSPI